MTLQQKLELMNTKYATLFLYSGSSRETFHAELKYENYNKNESFQIKSAEYTTIAEAVDELLGKFQQITGGKAFIDAVPAQITYEQPPEYNPTPVSNFDDEVPF